MIKFELNGAARTYEGDETISLLTFLRQVAGIFSAKDGCSGQGACGACLVEVNGRPRLACVTPMARLQQARIVTIEGFPAELRRILGRAFVAKGAVQCGFCTPGFLTRAKILLQDNPRPSTEEIRSSLGRNLCRCTGYVKIVEAVELAAQTLAAGAAVNFDPKGGIGAARPKYGAYDKALGRSPFVGDLQFEDMLHGALRFSDHPRARVIRIDPSAAEAFPGVVKVFTAGAIPGQRFLGPIRADWPQMVAEGETTRYIGDVLAVVAAQDEATARHAAALIHIDYEVLPALIDPLAAETSPIKIHDGGNLLHHHIIRRGGDAEKALEASAFVSRGTYRTHRVEHAFLETEGAVAEPLPDRGLRVHVQSQGVYEDRRQIAALLALPEDKVEVALVPCGGGFGGKEDLTAQGHAALLCHHLHRPVKVRLSREESLRMHPKRHPMILEYALGCDARGKLTALRARILGDTGAYASVGAEVLARACTHASGAYHVPVLDLESKAVYTNNIPCGAMRGFGVPQVTFAMEGAMQDLIRQGGFDPWQFRFDNALDKGGMTPTGQVLGRGVGLRQTLLAVKDDFYRAGCAGIACGLKNCGIGNGIVDESEVVLEVLEDGHLLLQHGWTEMGQGVDTVAVQLLCQETGLDPEQIRVQVTTQARARAGMTTASRATILLGNAILDAAARLVKDLRQQDLSALKGRVYKGGFRCDWTNDSCEPGRALTHLSYGYATHVVILDEAGRIDQVVAAHDAGRIINPTLFEGQIEGAVAMGLGYALSETLPLEDGRLVTTRFNKLGLLRIKEVPRIKVVGVEVPDPVGPHGAKGVGEIGMVPTAAAVANAFSVFDRQPRFELPLTPVQKVRGLPEQSADTTEKTP